MLPGLNVEAPMPSVPKSESFSMIATMRGISTPYCCAAANTIVPVTGLPGVVDCIYASISPTTENVGNEVRIVWILVAYCGSVA